MTLPEPYDLYDVFSALQERTPQEVWRASALAVLVRPLVNHGTDGMVDRDLLKLGVLQYVGHEGAFAVTYP